MSDLEFWKDLGNIFDAVLNYQKKNVEFNNRFINPWIRLGNIFERGDQHTEAVQAYKHAAEIDPENAQSWADLGDAQFKAGAHDDAVASYQTAVDLDPEAGWPLGNLALTLVAQGKAEEAIPLYLKSIELLTETKDKAICWNRLGNAYRKINDYENAFLAFKNADQLDHGNTGFEDKLDEMPEDTTVIAPEAVLEQMIVEEPVSVEAVEPASEAVEETSQPEAEVLMPSVVETESGLIALAPNMEIQVEDEVTVPLDESTLTEMVNESIESGQVEESSPLELHEQNFDALKVVEDVIAKVEEEYALKETAVAVEEVSEVTEAAAEPVEKSIPVMVEEVAEVTEAAADPVEESAPVMAEAVVEPLEESASVMVEEVAEAAEAVAEPVEESIPVMVEEVAEAAAEPVEESAPVMAEAVVEPLEDVMVEEVAEVTEAAAEPMEESAPVMAEAVAEPVEESAPVMAEEVVESAEAVAKPMEEPVAAEEETTKPSRRAPAWLTIKSKLLKKYIPIEETQPVAENEVNAEELAQVTSVTTFSDVLPEVAVNESALNMDVVETYSSPLIAQGQPVVEEANAQVEQPVDAVAEQNEEDVVESNEQADLLDEDALTESETQIAEPAYEEYLEDVVEPAGVAEDRAAQPENEAPLKVSENGEVRLVMDTKNAHVWNELGNVYMNAGAYDDAIASYSKAIELDRRFAWPYSNLALAYVQKERFAEAILLYQRGIELFVADKDKAVTWNRLGNVYRRINDYDNAIASYKIADELDPDNATLSLRSSFGLLGNMYPEQKPAYAA